MSSVTVSVSGAVTREPEPVAEVPMTVFELSGVGVSYGNHLAVDDVSMDVTAKRITGLIGPSGCGKSTLLRCLNRMNDLVPGATVHGKLAYHGQELYASDVDPVEVRRR